MTKTVAVAATPLTQEFLSLMSARASHNRIRHFFKPKAASFQARSFRSQTAPD